MHIVVYGVVVVLKATFDIEIDAYKHHLEQVYRLCHACDLVIRRELSRQDAVIRAKMHGAGLLRSASTINADISRLSQTDLLVCWYVKVVESDVVLCLEPGYIFQGSFQSTVTNLMPISQ